jgi:VWFA-related protein
LVINAVRNVLDTGEAENRDTYRQLGIVLRTLSSKPGTRILLFASPGFPLAMLTNEASGIVDLANRQNVVINTMDARGPYTLAPGGDISERFSDAPSTVGLKTSFRLAEQSDQQFVLMDLAFGTGGTFFHSNDFEAGLKQAGSPPEVSYVLGFSPQNKKMDGRCHTLKVTLSEQNKYAIQARRGYFAPKKLDDPEEVAKQEIRCRIFAE